MRQLRPYQDKLIRDAAFKATLGHKRIILQAPTGAGKSVIFATLIKRYTDRNPAKKVLIACHREKLVKQSRKALYDWYEIIAEPIFAETRHLPPAQVYTGMAETLHRRFSKNHNYIRDIGLLVVDECHLGLFTKIFDYLPDTLIIGFTATPIAASKKHPLNGIYNEIVCGPQINDLIAEGSLTMNITHRVKDAIDRKQLKTKSGEYDQEQAGKILSSAKYVNNTLEAYTKFCAGRKTIIFNSNVDHSKTVTAAFVAADFDCRHLDGYMTKASYDQTMHWFENTPDAILCNVGVATTGFDIPDIGAVIINKATKSLPLFIQMAGRGSRLFPGKKDFIIVDMARNYLDHGDWSDYHDWEYWFTHPDKPKEGGVSPVKDCPKCEAMIHAGVRVCPFCQEDVSKAPVYDEDVVLQFETLVQGKPIDLSVSSLVVNNSKATHADGTPYKKWSAIHQIKHRIISQAKTEWKVEALTDLIAYKLLDMYQEKVQEWCKETNTRYDAWVRSTSTQWFFDELKRVYGWEPQKLSIAV